MAKGDRSDAINRGKTGKNPNGKLGENRASTREESP